MKTLQPLLVICLLAISSRNAAAAERTILVRVTAYWPGEGCGVHASWNGAQLHNGHCAVDPKRIAFGSKLIFPDTVCTAVDTGPDVVSRKAARTTGHSAAQRNALVIDRFFETKAAAIAWLRDHPSFMTIRVADADHWPKNPNST
jgi:3D (Asp-Asp-Asp) domain-containing protein